MSAPPPQSGVGDVDLTWVPAHLVRRGLAAPDEVIDVRSLPGGVSGQVAVASIGAERVVVKRAAARLRVAEEWHADARRAIREGEALLVAGAIAPEYCPTVHDIDRQTATIVIEAAPNDWRDWRAELSSGRFDAPTAQRVGEALAAWHIETARRPQLVADLADQTVFVDLRIAPFYETCAERHPDLAAAILDAAAQLRCEHSAFVHGDFSPKNLLVGDGRVWAIDWEAAHLGAPVFDLAFLLTHLIIEALARPASCAATRMLAAEFLAAHRIAGGPVPSDALLARHVGCLMLARVDGKSPTPDLDAAVAAHLRIAARSVLAGPPRDVLDIWKVIA